MQLIVLGMHRSGTSALARLLTAMGAYFGSDSLSTGANEENPKGFWERRDIRTRNDALLKSVSADWDQIDNFDLEKIPEHAVKIYNLKMAAVIEDLDKNQPWMIKEPRLCLLYPLLDPLLKSPVCLHIFRHPLEVAKSLQQRNDIPIASGVGLWERYNSDALSATLQRPRILISYNDLIEQPISAATSLLEQLSNLGVTGLSLPDVKAIEDIIDPSLYREQYSNTTLENILNTRQIELYQTMLNGSILDSPDQFSLSEGGKFGIEDHQSERRRAFANEKNLKDLTILVGQLERKTERMGLLRKQIASLEHELTAKDHEQEKLRILTDQMVVDTKALLSSRRWEFGKLIFSIPYRLLGRAQPELASQNIERIFKRYRIWSERHTLLANIKAVKDANALPDEDAPKPYTPLDPEQHQQNILNYNQNKQKKRCVVYTSITGRYDDLKVPENPDPDFDYICFTDYPIKDHPVWQFRPTLYFNADQTRIARYYKLHPHIYFQDYDIAVWVDANILIRKNFKQQLDKFLEGDQPLGIFTHYSRDCTYEEAIECIDSEKDETDTILRQIGQYTEEGFPRNFGLPETNMVISRPNDQRAQAVFNTWWLELDNGSKRDQLAIMYALWKNQTNYTPISTKKEEMARFDRENFDLFNHQGKRSHSHPSIYEPPSFLKEAYQNSTKAFWELEEEISTDTRLDQTRSASLDIVIPVHNAIDDVINCLNSVIKYRAPHHKILLVDDGSDEETRDYLSKFQLQHSNYVELARHQQAQGYTKAANAGMRLSTADYVVLLNSDTIVSREWSEKLIACAMSASNIGIVGPMSNAASWQSIPAIKDKDGSYSVNPFPKGVDIDLVNHWCEKYSMSVFPRVQLVNGFCFLITRILMDTIGYFDDISYPKGYNEENDYCFRCSDNGFELAIATNTYVYHAKSKSYTPQKRLQLCEESRVVFEARYGITRISRATESLRLNPLINRVRTNVAKEWSNV